MNPETWYYGKHLPLSLSPSVSHLLPLPPSAPSHTARHLLLWQERAYRRLCADTQQLPFGCPGPGCTAWRCSLHSGRRAGGQLGFLGKELLELTFGSGTEPAVGTSPCPVNSVPCGGGVQLDKVAGMPSEAWRSEDGCVYGWEAMRCHMEMGMWLGGGPWGWRWGAWSLVWCLESCRPGSTRAPEPCLGRCGALKLSEDGQGVGVG